VFLIFNGREKQRRQQMLPVFSPTCSCLSANKVDVKILNPSLYEKRRSKQLFSAAV